MKQVVGEVPVTETPTVTLAIKDGPRGADLRELHRVLESRRQFADWAKANLSQFVDGEDFVVYHNLVVNSSGGRPRKDYAVLIDSAKHIAMMEQTERGRQVRAYVIECERALKD